MRRFLSVLGPGLVTGAADNDPSGITTYSITGATFGYGLLWTVLLEFPLMVAVQLMCARLSMVTGRTLAGAMRRQYSRWLLGIVCGSVLFANILQLGADLAGMGEVMEMMTGMSRFIWSPLFAASITVLLAGTAYGRMAKILKWLTLVLFAYLVAAPLAHPRWSEVLRGTLVPHVEWRFGFLATLLGVLGASLSPYLFFWIGGQEVEEERAAGRLTIQQRKGASIRELRAARTDVMIGMVFASLIHYFVILCTASTLHVRGDRSIETARQAAEALRPLAGELAYLLFAIGLIGGGILGVSVLAGSSAFVVAGALNWPGSLSDRLRAAPRFYAVVIASLGVGAALGFLGVSPVRLLFVAAVVNGTVAPWLIALIIRLSSDPRVMGRQVAPNWIRWLGWVAVALMGGASVAMWTTVSGP